MWVDCGMALTPTAEGDRIQSLDVLRGFALLGILLLNILGFGLVSASYSNAGYDLLGGSSLDWIVWASVELSAEGAMRALFSILFGAGVLLFTTGDRAKGGWTYYRRTFWLLMFGLIDAYLLLWSGDILVCYALAGALLYLLRNRTTKTMLIIFAVLLTLISGFYGVIRFGLAASKEAAVELAAMEDPSSASDELRSLAEGWEGFSADFLMTPEAEADELAARRGSYASAFEWNLPQTNKMMFTVLPMFLFWDALVMMLLGMALYRSGVLQGERSTRFYVTMMLGGFAVGLSVNGYEVWQGVSTNMDLFAIFAQFQPTYHIGRLGMALGYIGLLVLIVRAGRLAAMQQALANVGRMALTNYLMQSLICLLLFTGAGLGLVAVFSRSTMYLFVVGIWIFQILFSGWWLARYRFGPVEWLWRALTYGSRPPMVRT